MGRRWLATGDFGNLDPQVRSGPLMTSNGGPVMTSVPWLLVVAFKLLLNATHTISLTSASLLGHSQSSWCADNGCAEQFEGLGGCVNLAAPLQISGLSTRFDLAATSLKGLCGAVGCCHCMKLLPNSTEAAIASESKPSSGPKKPTATKPSAKKPGANKPKPKKPKNPKAKKPKSKKPKKPKSKKPKRPKPKKPKTKKPKPKKPKSKTPKSKNQKPKTKKPKPKQPKSKTPKSKNQKP